MQFNLLKSAFLGFPALVQLYYKPRVWRGAPLSTIPLNDALYNPLDREFVISQDWMTITNLCGPNKRYVLFQRLSQRHSEQCYSMWTNVVVPNVKKRRFEPTRQHRMTSLPKDVLLCAVLVLDRDGQSKAIYPGNSRSELSNEYPQVACIGGMLGHFRDHCRDANSCFDGDVDYLTSKYLNGLKLPSSALFV
jgi:hypothetical protein